MKINDTFSAIKADNLKHIKLRFIVVSYFMILFIACSSSNGRNRSENSFGHKNDFPRLIITKNNLDKLILKSKTSHKHLFDLTVEQADEFLGRTPPQMVDAHNQYREIGEQLPSLGLMYLINGEAKYLKGAEKWIRALLAVPDWNGSQNLGRCSWTMGISLLYDWLYNDLDEGLKEQVITRLKKEGEIIMETASSTRALSNHLLIEAAALGMAGLILPHENTDRTKFLNQSDQWVEYIIQNAPLDGSWGEGIQYWQYGLGYFLRFLESAQTSGYKNYFTEYNWLKKTGRFPIHFSAPDNLIRVINFGDCNSESYIPSFLLYLPASKYKDGVIQDFAIKVQATEPHKLSWFDFLTFDETIKQVDYTTVEEPFHYFDDYGFVTMRSSWNSDATLIGFRCGPAPGIANQLKPEREANRGYGPGHQQPDINNFVVYANGTWLAMDPGYTRLKETRNHNTILVNGYGQAGAGEVWLDYMAFQERIPFPKIVYTASNPQVDYVIGNAGNIYVDEARLESFERHLMFVKPNIILIADKLSAGENSTIDWLLHANEIAVVRNHNTYLEIKKEEASLTVFPLAPDNINPLVTEREMTGSDVYGKPGYSGDSAIQRTINLNTKGSNVNYLIALVVNKPGEIAAEVAFNNNVINISKNGKKISVRYMPDGELSKPVLELINIE